MKTIVIDLKDYRMSTGRQYGEDFKVIRVTNSVSYKIGSYLSRETVNHLCSEAGIEVIIGGDNQK